MQKFGSVFNQEVSESWEQACICVFLMFEDQNTKSKFKDYINTLTNHNPILFCDWPNEILDEVQDPQLIDSTLEMQADIDVNLEEI